MNAYKQWEDVMIQDNLQPDIWHEEPTWNNELGKKRNLLPR